jgi:hypothetical protein
VTFPNTGRARVLHPTTGAFFEAGAYRGQVRNYLGSALDEFENVTDDVNGRTVEKTGSSGCRDGHSVAPVNTLVYSLVRGGDHASHSAKRRRSQSAAFHAAISD